MGARRRWSERAGSDDNKTRRINKYTKLMSHLPGSEVATPGSTIALQIGHQMSPKNVGTFDNKIELS